MQELKFLLAMSFYLILVYEINVYITTFAYILFNNSKIRHLPCP